MLTQSQHRQFSSSWRWPCKNLELSWDFPQLSLLDLTSQSTDSRPFSLPVALRTPSRQAHAPVSTVTLLSFFDSFFTPQKNILFCLVTQSYPTLCDFMDYSPQGSSVLGISQARRVEWTAISSSRRSSWPRNRTWISCIAGRFCTAEPHICLQ